MAVFSMNKENGLRTFGDLLLLLKNSTCLLSAKGRLYSPWVKFTILHETDQITHFMTLVSFFTPISFYALHAWKLAVKKMITIYYIRITNSETTTYWETWRRRKAESSVKILSSVDQIFLFPTTIYIKSMLLYYIKFLIPYNTFTFFSPYDCISLF